MRTMLGLDGNGDFRPIKLDINAGLFAGQFGSIYSTWYDYSTGSSGGAGTTWAQSVAVPANYIYVADTIVVYHGDAVNSDLNLFFNDGVTDFRIDYNSSVAPYTVMKWNGIHPLTVGQCVRASFTASLANRLIRLTVNGYMVKLK